MRVEIFGNSGDELFVSKQGPASTISDDIKRSNDDINGDLRSVSGDIKISQTKVKGNLNTVSGDITVSRNSDVSVKVYSTSGDIKIDNSNIGGNIMTISGDIELEESHVQGNVMSKSGDISLSNSRVECDVIVDAGSFAIEHSSIGGGLEISTALLTLNSSKVNNIKVLPASSGVSNVIISGGDVVSSIISSGVFIGGGNVVIGGRRFGSGGGSVISVGHGSVSNVNGYNVTATATETRVITPDGTIFVNGDKIHGNGPNTYAEYKSSRSNAPTIRGPGWKDEGSGISKGIKTTQKDEGPKEPDQIVELKNGSEVSGVITFEDGNGKVVVSSNSRFTGKVSGGIVEKQ